jgi:hypothetical protein
MANGDTHGLYPAPACPLPDGTIEGTLGAIAGQLTGPDGAPGAFITVNAHNLDTDQTSYGFAGEDGTYSFAVLPGAYRVSFVRGHGEQWAYQAADTAHAHVFTVAAGQTVAVDDTLLPTGSLGGTLTGTDGTPLPETEVDLHRGGEQVATAYTSDGAYSFDGLLPGDYQVSFPVNDTVQWLKGRRSPADATTYTVVAGRNTVADDAVLPPSVLRGRLIDTTGAALADYHVRAERSLADGSTESYDATTDADGAWRIQGELDGDYLVSFQTPGYGRTQWVPGKGSATDAKPVAISAGTTVTVDETWLPGATLTVTAADAATGAPLTGFCVWVLTPGDGSACTTGTTATVEDLPAGVFQAQVSPQSPTFYLQSDFVPVTLAAGRSTSVSVPVRQGGRVAVTVTDHATGQPVNHGCVSLRPLGDGGIGEGAECSNANGKVTTVPITPGTYEMFVSAPGQYGDQWVGAAGGTGDQRAAARIVVKAGKTAPAPAVLLDRAGSISGTVTGPDAKPVAEADVSIQAWDYGAGPGYDTHTDADGRYTLAGLGPYAWPLSFTAARLPRQWSGNVPNRFNAETVPVNAGATATYDMALTGGTTVNGKVTVGRPSRRPLPGNPRTCVREAPARNHSPTSGHSIPSRASGAGGRSPPAPVPGSGRAHRLDPVEQREQVDPVALLAGLVVHRRVGHGEAVRRALVHLGGVRHAGLVERRLQRLDLLLGHRPVVVGVTEVRLADDAADAQVRAVRLVGGEPAAVEAGHRLDPVRVRLDRLERVGAAHAVPDDHHRPRVDAALPGEEVQVRLGVAGQQVGAESLDQRHQRLERLAPLLRVLQGGHVDQRRPSTAVQNVRREHRVAPLGDSVGHLLEAGTHAERVHEDQNAGMRAVTVGHDQVRVGDAVLGRHVHHRLAHATPPASATL